MSMRRSGAELGRIRESVRQFASLVELKKLSGEDISVLVRGATEIFDDFFVAKHVIDVSTLRQELKSVLAEEGGRGSRPAETEQPNRLERRLNHQAFSSSARSPDVHWS